MKIIETIIHISDIHIRLNDRKEEYKKVFDSLFKFVKNKKQENENILVIITGDLFHLKTNLTPEAIFLFNYLVTNLGDICEVIVFPGNHDANMNNPDRMDSIDPLMKIIEKVTNAQYYRNSITLEYENLYLHHFSLFDNPYTMNLVRNNIKDDKLNFGIFHGLLDGARNDFGFELKSNHMNNSFFNGLDGILLGDIHKRQMLQRRNKENNKPEIWYAGSLIQQDFGESLIHGGLIWNIEGDDFLVEDFNIKNEYGYITIKVEDGEIVSEIKNVPEKPQIRIDYKNTSNSKLKEIKNYLYSKYPNIQKIKTQKIEIKEEIEHSSSDFKISNVRDIGYQSTIMKKYLKEEYNLNETDINKILNINIETNKEAKIKDEVRNISWKPLYFEFSNILSYGENNIIDFRNFNGIYGLFAPNASGKSGFLDSLLFCIFDKTSRASKTNYIINKEKDNLYCRFLFELNGKEYEIIRYGKRDNKDETKIPISVEFNEINGENKISLNGKDRNDTNSIIRNFIGTYDDFILTSFSLQNNGKNYIESKQTDRKHILGQFLDINIFDFLLEIAKKNSNELSTFIKSEKNKNYEEEYKNSKDRVNEYDKELESNKSSLNQLKLNHEEIITNISDLKSKLKEVDNKSNIDVEKEKTLIEYLNSEIKKKENDIIISESEIKKIEEEINKFKNKSIEINNNINLLGKDIKELNPEKIEQDDKHRNLLKESINEIRNKIRIQENSLENKKETLEHLNSHKYNEECEICLENFKDIDEKKKKLMVDIHNINSSIEKLRNESSQYYEDIKQYSESDSIISNLKLKQKEFNILKEDFFGLNTKIETYKSNVEKLKIKIQNLKEENNKIQLSINDKKNLIELFYKNEQDIIENKRIELEINKLLLDKDKSISEILIIEKEVERINRDLGYHKNIIQRIKDSINQLSKKEKEFSYYKYYIDMVSKNGLPKYIISSVINNIEDEINVILSDIVDFKIFLEVDENNVETYISYNENSKWPAELGSGMERFISSLAIRIALINITNLPKPTFIAIDEGWGSLDTENLHKIPLLFDVMRNKFDFTLIVSHIDNMKDMVDGLIEIEKINEMSVIR